MLTDAASTISVILFSLAGVPLACLVWCAELPWLSQRQLRLKVLIGGLVFTVLATTITGAIANESTVAVNPAMAFAGTILTVGLAALRRSQLGELSISRFAPFAFLAAGAALVWVGYDWQRLEGEREAIRASAPDWHPLDASILTYVALFLVAAGGIILMLQYFLQRQAGYCLLAMICTCLALWFKDNIAAYGEQSPYAQVNPFWIYMTLVVLVAFLIHLPINAARLRRMRA